MERNSKSHIDKRIAKRVMPPDPEGMNDKRAEWAAAAIEVFREETGTDFEDALCDLLADLMHWCDRHRQLFEAQLLRARYHYECETDPSGKDCF